MEMAAEVKRRHPFGSILFPFTFMALVIQPFSELQQNMYGNVVIQPFSELQKKHGWKCLASTYSLPTPASGEASRTLK